MTTFQLSLLSYQRRATLWCPGDWRVNYDLSRLYAHAHNCLEIGGKRAQKIGTQREFENDDDWDWKCNSLEMTRIGSGFEFEPPSLTPSPPPYSSQTLLCPRESGYARLHTEKKLHSAQITLPRYRAFKCTGRPWAKLR